MIEGKRISLRRIRDEEECSRLYEIYNDLTERALTDHDETYAIGPKLSAFRDHGMWTDDKGLLVVVNQANAILGTISFIRTSDLECDIGYRILRTADRGKGMMTEAVSLFCEHLFDRFPRITRLQIRTAHDNEPSIRLAQRCGFTQEGVLRKAYAYRGRLCDCIVFGLLRDECHAIET